MTTHNSYIAYKRDSRHLLYWMIWTSNAIIQTSASTSVKYSATKSPNLTGQTTVIGIVTMAELIASHVKRIPPVIYRLFRSVISARKATYLVFRQMAAQSPDPEMESSNASHKYFIDTLTTAFQVLGGEEWLSKRESEKSDGPAQDDDIEGVIFSNKFSAFSLNVSKGDAEDEIEDEAGQDSRPTVEPQRGKQKKPSSGKGKKGKKGKKTQKKRKTATVEEQSLDEIPLESYRIIEGHDGLVTEYLMAIIDLVKEWVGLRSYLQGIWREVAYGGLNTVVAGAVSKMAITMVIKTEAAIFVDFPGHDTYEVVLNTITRGNPEKAQDIFSVALQVMRPDRQQSQPIQSTVVQSTVVQSTVAQSTVVDGKEQYLLYAYQHLCDFVTDFQKTRSGKPTRPMLAEIGNWDPYLDLQKAIIEERIRWRRSYTINWLYDLVNVFSSVKIASGDDAPWESVDWSVYGPWGAYRRIYGLTEFAAFITSLVMQKPGTDVRKRISPHHVFQLQCIVDSWTISKGWSQTATGGHDIGPPAPWFRLTDDIESFLDPQDMKFGTGYLQAVDLLKMLLFSDGHVNGDHYRHKAYYETL